MEHEFTTAQLVQLIGQLQTLFDQVEVDEASAAARPGFTLGYAPRLTGTDCVLTTPITVDGTPRLLRLRAPVAGAAAAAEDVLDARGMEIYRDDMLRDFLTGAYNRRYWEGTFCRGVSAQVAAGKPVAVALVKIDGFDQVVRAHGQPVADQLTCYVANLWKKYYNEPGQKVVARLTGHTFAVGCVGAEEFDLESQMRVLYQRMNLTCIATVGMMCRVPFTLSVGCAGTGEVENKIWPDLYALCDQRLRAQAAAGGDGVFAVAQG